jgi:peroxiredoxin
VELVALQATLPEITAVGGSLVAISPQLSEHSRELIERRHLTFEILADRGNGVASQFGLRFSLPDYLRRIYLTFPLDLEAFNGDSSWTLPIPARFVIDREGVVQTAESDPDYTTRPEPAETLSALRAIPH